MALTPQQLVLRTVWRYYRQHGRHDLPWRQTRDPYKILVSEVMLQQTQVPRVVPKYREFLKLFPNVHTLARAELRDVLTLWQGLGYNRRAKALHDAVRVVVRDHNGILPRTFDELRQLPGVGPYTAGAVCTFAYDQPVAMVETNIRAVILHHLLPHRHSVPDSEVLELARSLVDRKRPREWYWALMDYGAYLKTQGVRTNARSAHYAKQTMFKGSDRQIRGAILTTLTRGEAMRPDALASRLRVDPSRVRSQLSALAREGLVRRRKGSWSL